MFFAYIYEGDIANCLSIYCPRYTKAIISLRRSNFHDCSKFSLSIPPRPLPAQPPDFISPVGLVRATSILGDLARGLVNTTFHVDKLRDFDSNSPTGNRKEGSERPRKEGRKSSQRGARRRALASKFSNLFRMLLRTGCFFRFRLGVFMGCRRLPHRSSRSNIESV